MNAPICPPHLDVELKDDGRHQACGAILAIAFSAAAWGAVIALVLR